MARDVVAAADDEARTLAQAMLAAARFGALAWTDPETGTPGISRIGFGLDAAGVPLTLISALAPHEAALRSHPDCALMLGEVGARGDPLTHPRLMLRLQAQFVAADDPARAALRADWLKGHPKAALYVDFADFAFLRLVPQSALLNAGFAKAYRLQPADLMPDPPL
jgi:heme iron utilization protein